MIVTAVALASSSPIMQHTFRHGLLLKRCGRRKRGGVTWPPLLADGHQPGGSHAGNKFWPVHPVLCGLAAWREVSLPTAGDANFAA